MYGFMRRSKSSTGMRRAHLFSGVSGGRRSASAAVDGATAIPHLNEDTLLLRPMEAWCRGSSMPILIQDPEGSLSSFMIMQGFWVFGGYAVPIHPTQLLTSQSLLLLVLQVTITHHSLAVAAARAASRGPSLNHQKST